MMRCIILLCNRQVPPSSKPPPAEPLARNLRATAPQNWAGALSQTSVRSAAGTAVFGFNAAAFAFSLPEDQGFT